MAVLENIEDSELQVSASVDFSRFTNGGKYTTLFNELKIELDIAADDEMLFHCIVHCIKEHKAREIKNVDLKARQLEIMQQAKIDVQEVNNWDSSKIQEQEEEVNEG